MMVSIGHIFVLEVVNVYCMVPLIWRSVLNAPLFAIFHLVIAVNGEIKCVILLVRIVWLCSLSSCFFCEL